MFDVICNLWLFEGTELGETNVIYNSTYLKIYF